MIIDSNTAEQEAILRVAQNMCAAARTAPKACGIDNIITCIVTGDNITSLADEMDRLADVLNYPFFNRDAKNIRVSNAVVVIGCRYRQRGLGAGCAYCNHTDCSECAQNNGVCIYDPLDLGIALGSAVSIAADARIDNRILFSAGKAVLSLGFLGSDANAVMCIPLSATNKSPYFDRK